MKVLRLLTRPNAGGPTRQAIALWHAQRALGVRTLLVVGTCHGEPALDPALHGVPGLAFAEALARGPLAEGVVVLPHLAQRGGPFGTWRASRELRRLVRAVRPDVVHTHLAKAGFVGRLVAHQERVPVIAHTYHGHVLHDYFAAPKQAALRLLERRLARLTGLLFAISPSCRDEMLALGVGTPERMRIVRPALALQQCASGAREAARARLGIPAGVPVVAWCGRLVPIKRFAWFAELVRALPETRALVVGDGPERGLLAALGPRGHAFPFLEKPWETLVAADLLAMPSVREGMPLAALEALANGVAVAGCAVPGLADLLAIVAPRAVLPARDDRTGFVRMVAELFADPARRARQTELAGPLLAECAPSAVAAALLSAYEEATRRTHAEQA